MVALKMSEEKSYGENDIDYLDSIILEDYEIIDGDIYMMGATSADHGYLTSNIGRLLGNQTVGSPCMVLVESMRVSIEDNVYRPDVTLVCEKMAKNQTITDSPFLIVEVLSPSTEFKDRNKKLFSYMKIKSLKGYIIVNKNKKMLELYFRGEKGISMCTYVAGETLKVGDSLTLNVDEVYMGMELFEDDY